MIMVSYKCIWLGLSPIDGQIYMNLSAMLMKARSMRFLMIETFVDCLHDHSLDTNAVRLLSNIIAVYSRWTCFVCVRSCKWLVSVFGQYSLSGHSGDHIHVIVYAFGE